jgi:hypothetical protein
MFDWFKKKDKEPPRGPGPDFSALDSLEKVTAAADRGELVKLLLMPEEFGGDDIPPNTVYVPDWVAEKKNSIDQNVVLPMAQAGKANRYSASPGYQGSSFVPNAITIEARDPGSFNLTIAIWGDALKSE